MSFRLASIGFRGLAFLLLVAGGAPRAWACYAVVVGRAASADGAVLVGHNEENGGRRVLLFHKIPRRQHAPGAMVPLDRGGQLAEVPRTWAMLWSENPGLAFSDGYMNEWGVAVVSDNCPSREDGYEEPVPWYAGVTAVAPNCELPAESADLLSLAHHFQPRDGTFDPDDRLAWWKAKAVERFVDADHAGRFPAIEAGRAALENKALAEQAAVETEALRLWPTDPAAARVCLTRHCVKLAEQACAFADKAVGK